MNCSKKVIALLIASFGGLTAAVAQDTGGANPQDPPIPASVLSRDEVLADLQIWRESGAAALHRENEGGTDFTDPGVQVAVARYDTLRASSRYAMLVAKLAEERGQQLLIAGSR